MIDWLQVANMQTDFDIDVSNSELTKDDKIWFYTPTGLLFRMSIKRYNGVVRIVSPAGEQRYDISLISDIVSLMGWGEFERGYAPQLSDVVVHGFKKVPQIRITKKSGKTDSDTVLVVLLRLDGYGMKDYYFIELVWDGDLSIRYIHGQSVENSNKYFLTSDGYFRTSYNSDTLNVYFNGERVHRSKHQIENDYEVAVVNNPSGLVITYITRKFESVVLGIFTSLETPFHTVLGEDVYDYVDREFLITKAYDGIDEPIQIINMLSGKVIQIMDNIDGRPLAYDDEHRILLLHDEVHGVIIGYRDNIAFEVSLEDLKRWQWIPWINELVVPPIAINIEYSSI